MRHLTLPGLSSMTLIIVATATFLIAAPTEPQVRVQARDAQCAPAAIVGTAGADFLRGTPAADRIDALEGNDVIDALFGNDEL